MEMSDGRWFSERTTELLESFYRQGLTGWGKKHADMFGDALKATSLSESQLKVCQQY